MREELIKVTLLQNTDENIHEVTAEILEERNRSELQCRRSVDLILKHSQRRKIINSLLKSEANLRKILQLEYQAYGY